MTDGSGQGPSGHGDLAVDHVVLAVEDLAAGARLLQDRCGLASVEGGHHPDWGTANRIVPLGDAFLELVAVVDDDRARRNPFGRWVAGPHPAPVQPLGWAVRTAALDEVARRLGLAASAGSRTRPDGSVVRWRLAGVEQAVAEPSLPFFLEWGDGTHHPGRTPAVHGAGAVVITRLHVDGDARRLASWLGGRTLPVSVRPGTPALTGITLAGPGVELTVDSSLR